MNIFGVFKRGKYSSLHECDDRLPFFEDARGELLRDVAADVLHPGIKRTSPALRVVGGLITSALNPCSTEMVKSKKAPVRGLL